MIRLTDSIFIGDSDDEQLSYSILEKLGIGAILNVAQDLNTTSTWPNVECMHIGLIDGPGNEILTYCVAVMALHTLSQRHNVLVCCHTGSRSLTVVIMYLGLLNGNIIERVDFLRRPKWEELLQRVQNLSGMTLPEIHTAHIKAFNSLPFGILEALL